MLDRHAIPLLEAFIDAYRARKRIGKKKNEEKRITVPEALRPQIELLLISALLNVDALDELADALIQAAGADWDDMLRDGLNISPRKKFTLPAQRLLEHGPAVLTDAELGMLLCDVASQERAHELLAEEASRGELSAFWALAIAERGGSVKWAARE